MKQGVGGGQSTDVAIALLTQLPQVRIMALSGDFLITA